MVKKQDSKARKTRSKRKADEEKLAVSLNDAVELSKTVEDEGTFDVDIPDEKKEDVKKVTQHEVDGELLRFEWKDGIPNLIHKETISNRKKVKTRYFKLTPIPWEFKSNITKRTHHINTGEGRKNLRFYQSNVERREHDPDKENIVAVDDEDIIRSLVSQVGLFQEVTEEEFNNSRE